MGIVLELQKDCLDGNISASTILRKAKTIAVKLELDDLKSWIDSELNGYKCSLSDLPAHRKGIGTPKFFNPYNGWCPFLFQEESKFTRIVKTVFLPQPVSELESLARSKDGYLVMKYNSKLEAMLHESLPMPMECSLHFGKGQVISALDLVRNKTLDWTLELESNKILGEGLTFAAHQKQEAQTITNHIYGGNFGVLGSMSGNRSNVGFFSATGDLDIEKLSALLPQLRAALPALPLEGKQAMEQEIMTLEEELNSSSPKNSKIKAALSSIKTVAEGIAGNLAASGILAALS